VTWRCIQLGNTLASDLGEGPSPSTRAKQRERLIQSVALSLSEPQRASKRRALGVGFAFALVTIVLVVCGIRWSHAQRAIRATWNGAPLYGPSVVEAATNRPQSLEFSEGSQVLLEPDSRVSLLRMSNHYADLTLDDGHILASIRRHTGVTWTFVENLPGTPYLLDAATKLKKEATFRLVGSINVAAGAGPAVDLAHGILRPHAAGGRQPALQRHLGALPEREICLLPLRRQARRRDRCCWRR